MLKLRYFKRALKDFSEVTRSIVDSKVDWNMIGLCRGQLGEPEASEEAYRRSLAIDPTFKASIFCPPVIGGTVACCSLVLRLSRASLAGVGGNGSTPEEFILVPADKADVHLAERPPVSIVVLIPRGGVMLVGLADGIRAGLVCRSCRPRKAWGLWMWWAVEVKEHHDVAMRRWTIFVWRRDPEIVAKPSHQMWKPFVSLMAPHAIDWNS